MIERIDRQRLAGLGAGDQVVVVAVGIAGPDALDDHGVLQVSGSTSRDHATLTRVRALAAAVRSDRAEQRLASICPNCGGELLQRPMDEVRPLISPKQSFGRGLPAAPTLLTR
ncbi:DUF1272 domain-containing protein [Variovorax sp. PBL-E5]|uniref:DUF1272 domain-containing protein n=1 Tax=Variovorax sp. PBL-E5 TaxID=434014 RepID=UPI003FCC80AE